MNKKEKVIEAYKLLTCDNEYQDGKITEEQLEKIVGGKKEAQESLNFFVAEYKRIKIINLKAEKEIEDLKKIINKSLTVLGSSSFDCEHGKVNQTISHKYEIDESKLSKDLFMPNHASIRSKVNKGENVEGVTKTIGYLSVSIR